MISRRRGWTVVAVLAGMMVVLSFVHPFGDVRTATEAGQPILSGAEVPPEVKSILEAKCADCHSQRTAWPAYSHLAPASWLIEHDVFGARRRVNLSHWQQYSFDEKQDLLQRIASESRSGEMPPRQYTLIHRDARLSAEEAQRIYEWAKGERKRLKAEAFKTKREDEENRGSKKEERSSLGSGGTVAVGDHLLRHLSPGEPSRGRQSRAGDL